MFWTVVKCHFRLLSRERLAWLSILLVFSTMMYSFAIGRRQIARESEAALEFLQRARDTAVRNQLLAQAIERRIAAGVEKEIIPPPFGSRHPAYAGAWSRQPSMLPPSPLKWLAVGQSDLYPTAFAGPDYDEVSALGNPLKLVRGHLDLSFIAVYLLPLVIIGLSFDTIASERDEGLLQLSLAQGVSAHVIVAAKVATMAAVVAGTTAAAFGAGLMFAHLWADMLQRTLLGGLAILGYELFWLSLALAINASGRSAGASLLMLAATWLAFVIVVPFASDRIALIMQPVPPVSTMVNADRAAQETVPAQDPGLVRVFLEHHPDVNAENLSDLGRLYLNRAARKEELDRLNDRERKRWEDALQAQETLARRLGVFSPAASLTESLIQLAGTGRERYLHFIEQKRAFEQKDEAFFFPRRLALPDSVFHAADYAHIPTMSYREEPLNSVLGRAAAPLLQLAAVTLLAIIGAALLHRRGGKDPNA